MDSGVPCPTRYPPFSPASGPKSIIWSAHLISSKLCSTTTIECRFQLAHKMSLKVF